MRRPDDDEADSKQTTPKGTVIPVSTREQVADGLRRLAKPLAKPSGDDSGSEE